MSTLIALAPPVWYETREGGGVGDLGEGAARRARALDLGDDLDAVGGRERRERHPAPAARASASRLDLGEAARCAALRGVGDGPGDEVGEHR